MCSNCGRIAPLQRQIGNPQLATKRYLRFVPILRLSDRDGEVEDLKKTSRTPELRHKRSRLSLQLANQDAAKLSRQSTSGNGCQSVVAKSRASIATKEDSTLLKRYLSPTLLLPTDILVPVSSLARRSRLRSKFPVSSPPPGGDVPAVTSGQREMVERSKLQRLLGPNPRAPGDEYRIRSARANAQLPRHGAAVAWSAERYCPHAAAVRRSTSSRRVFRLRRRCKYYNPRTHCISDMRSPLSLDGGAKQITPVGGGCIEQLHQLLLQYSPDLAQLLRPRIPVEDNLLILLRRIEHELLSVRDSNGNHSLSTAAFSKTEGPLHRNPTIARHYIIAALRSQIFPRLLSTGLIHCLLEFMPIPDLPAGCSASAASLPAGCKWTKPHFTRVELATAVGAIHNTAQDHLAQPSQSNDNFRTTTASRKSNPQCTGWKTLNGFPDRANFSVPASSCSEVVSPRSAAEAATSLWREDVAMSLLTETLRPQRIQDLQPELLLSLAVWSVSTHYSHLTSTSDGEGTSGPSRCTSAAQANRVQSYYKSSEFAGFCQRASAIIQKAVENSTTQFSTDTAFSFLRLYRRSNAISETLVTALARLESTMTDEQCTEAVALALTCGVPSASPVLCTSVRNLLTACSERLQTALFNQDEPLRAARRQVLDMAPTVTSEEPHTESFSATYKQAKSNAFLSPGVLATITQEAEIPPIIQVQQLQCSPKQTKLLPVGPQFLLEVLAAMAILKRRRIRLEIYQPYSEVEVRLATLVFDTLIMQIRNRAESITISPTQICQAVSLCLETQLIHVPFLAETCKLVALVGNFEFEVNEVRFLETALSRSAYLVSSEEVPLLAATIEVDNRTT